MTVKFKIPHHGQGLVLESPARFKVVSCGRRWGKTELGKSVLLKAALGRKQRTWWLAPTYLMASEVWRELKTGVRSVEGLRISESERRIDVSGGGLIAVRSTHAPDNLRGAGLDLAVLDEAAYIDPRVWPEVVRPMLANTRGSALFLSTPRGRNWFWEVFKIGQDPIENDWAAFQFATETNQLISAVELENIRRQTSEHVWQSEYEAHFTDASGQVFRRIKEAVRHGRGAEPIEGHEYVAGVDWGRSHDYTAMAVIDAGERQLVALDRFNQVSWELQRGRLAALAAQWRPRVIWAEANSFGEPNIEALQREGLPLRSFVTSAGSKAPLIESLALAIERGQLALLDDPVLLGELSSYAQEPLPGGGHRYSAPPGMHDDTVIALALAWRGVEHAGAPIGFL